MVEYDPYVKALTTEQNNKLQNLKTKLNEIKYATFGRWDAMIADDGCVYILENNSIAGAFENMREIAASKDGIGSPLDQACAEYLKGKGVIGMNSKWWEGTTILPIFYNYDIPFVRSPTQRLYFHNKRKQFFFSDKRVGTKREFVDMIWIRAGKKIGKRVRSEFGRYLERNGQPAEIDPRTFFPSLEFLILSSNKYDLIRAISKGLVNIPPTIYVRNRAQWNEQKKHLMELVEETTLKKHPNWEEGFEIVLKPRYGTHGKGIKHGPIEDLEKIPGEQITFPRLISPRIIASPHPERPESNVDVGVYSIGLTIPTGYVKIGAPGKLKTNLCAGGSGIPLSENLRKKLEPHIQLAVLSAEDFLRKSNGEIE